MPKFIMQGGSLNRRCGFTLVELLVVVSIIALLISILLPNLRSAREMAKNVKCAASCKSIGTAIAVHLSENNSFFPPAYLYPTDGGVPLLSGSGEAIPQNTAAVPNGYLHWSYFLYANGKVKDGVFQCPAMRHGGAPRTNPGLKGNNWELGVQIDAGGNTNPNTLEDKQATRMSYVGNAALLPRNKFTTVLSSGPRKNKLVQENQIKRPGDTVLLTEYLDNWKALGVPQDTYLHVKSHRPINVFYHLGSGFNEYLAPEQSPGFVYGLKGNPKNEQDFGVLKLRDVLGKANILDYTSGNAQINAVGRHHSGGDKEYGGTANFTFVDTHVERMTAYESVLKRKWGDRYYSISGRNEVLNYQVP